MDFRFAAGVLFLDELPHVAMAIDNDVISVSVNVKCDERNDWSSLRSNTSKIGFEVVFKLGPILGRGTASTVKSLKATASLHSTRCNSRGLRITTTTTTSNH